VALMLLTYPASGVGISVVCRQMDCMRTHACSLAVIDKDSQTMTLVRKARAIPVSKLSLLEQDNKESVHLVGVIAPAIVYRAVLRSGEGEVATELN
jgi:hypothetical protein